MSSRGSASLSVRRALFIFTSGFISFVLFYSFVASFSLRIFSFPTVPAVRFPNYFSSFYEPSDEEKLDIVLRGAAMEDNKTVILTTLNEAWAAPNSVFDLFLESFRTGLRTRRLLSHLVVIALDEKAYRRCKELHGHCYALVTEGVDFRHEAYFMTPAYLKMMWRRIDFLRTVLELGYNFVFTDTDIMWFRDPFPRFYPDADFQIACDLYSGDSLGLGNIVNGGFSYVKANNRSIEFYKFWHSSRNTYPGHHDQDVLNFIKKDEYVKDLGLKMRFLDTAYFGGLCEPSKDFNLVCTMHVNCCLGLDNKLNDLKVMLADWRNFLSLPPKLKRELRISWRVPQNCSIDAVLAHDSLRKRVEEDEGEE
ncbi:unnamed protein product [Linum tenue]|uniref:Nucleotide-diphospho-sugar transferase domain-containing protein n=1 Tax=Linum tenue TaxID=586396 RepID=A0AAV0NIZ8_9ROSI|nr:unnamed protein product [Linum tenue]